MELQYLPPMIYEFVVFLLGLFLAVQMGKKRHQKPNKITTNLFLNALLFDLAILVASVSRLLRLTDLWEIQPGVFLELLTISVCLIAFGNFFFLNFGLAIFYPETKEKEVKKINFAYMGGVVIFCIFAIISGITTIDLTTGIWIFLVILSLMVYIFIFISAVKLAAKLPEKSDKQATWLIGLSPVAYLLIFVNFFLDRLFGANFTVFYYIAWIFTIISVVCLYLGVFRPKWLKK